MAFVGVDVGLSWERARATIWKNFVYKTNDELDRMGIEDLKVYAEVCQDIVLDRVSNDTSSIGRVCVLSIYLLYLFIYFEMNFLLHYIYVW